MADARKPLLIVEDDPALQKQMQWAFDGYETIVADDRASAIAQLRRFEPAVVTMDLGLPPRPDDPTEGLALLEEMHSLAPGTKIIVLTGQSDRANALKAIALGAYDFCTKPFEPEVLTLTIERAFRLHELQAENARLQAAAPGALAVGPRHARPGHAARVPHDREGGADVGDRARARRVRHRQGAARARAARAVAARDGALRGHQLRRDSREPARERALRLREGRVHRAQCGRRRARSRSPTAARCSSTRSATCRCRCRPSCCASCRSGSSSASAAARRSRWTCASSAPRTRASRSTSPKGTFREDLYYRLAEIVVEVPPLRARHGDAALLAHAFVRRFADENRRGAMTLMPDAIAAIEGHAWPGNVRELENVLKRAVIITDGPTISAADLGLNQAPSEALNLREVREDAERQAVLRALGRVNGNLTRAAEMLGVSRPTLYDLIHRFGLK